MPVFLIAAVASNLVIGRGGRIPWHLRDDMTRFRKLTMDHPVVMGRLTWESLGKPLDGRRNIVLTRSPGLRLAGCEVVRTAEEVLAMTKGLDLFVIGGASVYALFLPAAARLYITHVDTDVPGDTFFPRVSWDQWRVVSEKPGTSEDPAAPPHRFVDYERR